MRCDSGIRCYEKSESCSKNGVLCDVTFSRLIRTLSRQSLECAQSVLLLALSPAVSKHLAESNQSNHESQLQAAGRCARRYTFPATIVEPKRGAYLRVRSPATARVSDGVEVRSSFVMLLNPFCADFLKRSAQEGTFLRVQ